MSLLFFKTVNHVSIYKLEQTNLHKIISPMKTLYSYGTVTEAINDLRKRDFTVDFNLAETHLICNHSIRHFPEDFEIVEVYRFEGESDPGDEAIVYGIESKHGSKGILVNGYGIYSEPMTDLLLKKLTIAN